MVDRGYDDPILENPEKYERIPNMYVFDKIVSAMKNLEFVKEVNNAYADMLKTIFENTTGLRTSL